MKSSPAVADPLATYSMRVSDGIGISEVNVNVAHSPSVTEFGLTAISIMGLSF